MRLEDRGSSGICGVEFEGTVERLGDEAAEVEAEARTGDKVVVLGETFENPFALVCRN